MSSLAPHGSETQATHGTVLCARHLLGGDFAREVEDACAKVGVQLLSWRGEPLAAPPQKDPALVVAGLPRGHRRVPDEIMQLLDARFPWTPLLLLCDEKLLRPQMSLQGGRITLIGQPVLGARIRSAIRAVLADQATGTSTDTLRGVAEFRSPVTAQRLERSQWWLGTLATRSQGAENQFLPLVYHRRLDGLVVLVAPPGRPRPEPAMMAEVVRTLRSDRQGDLGDALARILGDVGMVHLTAGEQEWIFHWPDSSRPLWLYSVLRLPALWNLANSFRGTFFRLNAAGADLIAAANAIPSLNLDGIAAASMSARPGGSVDPREAEFSSSLALGGAGALQFIETSLRDRGAVQPCSVALVEVR